MKILLRGGRVIDPAQNIDDRKDLLIEGDQITGIYSPQESKQLKVDEVIDLDEHTVVSPGFIDLHVHLRDPGQTEKEDMASGCRAAVAGGFTSILAMPNTFPVNDNVKTTRYMIDKAKEIDLCRVYPVGAITRTSMGEELSPIKDLVDAGCVAVSDDGRPCKDTSILRQAMERAKELGVPLIEHCEDLSVSEGATTIAQGPLADEMGLIGLPHTVESSDVARCLVLAAETGVQLHLAHISCKESMDMIREYKTKLDNVSTEVCPHHVLLTNEDIRTLGTQGKMYPPLRFQEDVDALRKALGDEVLQIVATDHAPHSSEQKQNKFELAPNGIIGLQSAFPLMMTLVDEGVLTLNQLIKSLTAAPAKVFNLKGEGSLLPGSKADVTIFKTGVSEVIDKKDNLSKSENSPFWEKPVSAKVCMTIVGGKEKYRVGI